MTTFVQIIDEHIEYLAGQVAQHMADARKLKAMGYAGASRDLVWAAREAHRRRLVLERGRIAGGVA